MGALFSAGWPCLSFFFKRQDLNECVLAAKLLTKRKRENGAYLVHGKRISSLELANNSPYNNEKKKKKKAGPTSGIEPAHVQT